MFSTLFEVCNASCKASKLLSNFTWVPYLHVHSKKDTDEPSKQTVDAAFSVLCGLESFETFKDQLPPDLRKFDTTQIDTIKWKDIETWVDWWKRPHVLKKLSKAYSLLPPEEWEDLPGTTNPVESINRQSIPQNVKSVSLKPLVEHMYLEDRRHAILEVATSRNITFEYQTKVTLEKSPHFLMQDTFRKHAVNFKCTVVMTHTVHMICHV